MTDNPEPVSVVVRRRDWTRRVQRAAQGIERAAAGAALALGCVAVGLAVLAPLGGLPPPVVRALAWTFGAWVVSLAALLAASAVCARCRSSLLRRYTPPDRRSDQMKDYQDRMRRPMRAPWVAATTSKALGALRVECSGCGSWRVIVTRDMNDGDIARAHAEFCADHAACGRSQEAKPQ